MGRKESQKLKADIIQELKDKAARAQIGILTDFTGLKVETLAQLRRQVKEADGELKVAKNTLLTRSAADASLIAPLTDQFVGPNALAFGYADPVPWPSSWSNSPRKNLCSRSKAGCWPGKC